MKKTIKTLALLALAAVLLTTACGREEVDSNIVITSEEWVDMGLSSGVLWNACNVGAITPEDYGRHYAWGETQPKENYSWFTYLYCNGDFDRLTKYCTVLDFGNNNFHDTLTILKPGDDPATAALGGDARTPTRREWQELLDSCIATWTTQNGVNGYRLVSNNGNSIFLPAAGFRWDATLEKQGSHCVYWSSSLNTSNPDCAWYFYVGPGYELMDSYYRSHGFSIRPVRTQRQTP